MKSKTKCCICDRPIDGSFGRMCCRCDQIRQDAAIEAIERGENI